MTTRLTDPDAIEHRLLELAYTTTADLTPAALAYFAPCSIADAEKLLDALAASGRVQLDVDDNGTLHYALVGRTTLASGPPQQPPPPAPLSPAPSLRSPFAIVRGPPRYASPTLAAVLSLFVPGAGHAYVGRWASAVLWFVLVGAAYSLILPGLVLHVVCMISSASSAHRINASWAHEQHQLPSGIASARAA